MVTLRGLFGMQERAPRIRTLTATDGRDILSNNDPAGWEVNAPWLWWVGAPDGSPNVYGNPPPGAGAYGEATYVSIPAVSRCTSIVSDTIAGLPWKVMRGWEDLGSPAWITDPQALRIDKRIHAEAMSDVKYSAVEFWSQWVTSALWWGDGYVYAPVRGADGQPVPPLWILHPRSVTIDGPPDRLRYYVNEVELAPGSVLHLRGEAPYRGGHGSGVMEKHGLELSLAAQVREYAASAYKSGVPYGYLKSTQPRMDATAAADLKAKWLDQHGSATRSIAVLNATTEFVPLTNVSPIDAQLDSARTWADREVAIAFGVPPYMLGVPGDSSTYANVESRMIELRQFTLLPWIRRIESCLDAQFPAGTELLIATSGLERADTKTRYETYKTGIEAGVLTRDEARALENLPPLGSSADPALPTGHPGPGPGDLASNPPVVLTKAEEVTP